MARITMNLPDELLEDIDSSAKRMNVNRTAYIVMSLTQKQEAEKVTKALPELSRLMEDVTRKMIVMEGQKQGVISG
jgi:metal-responsive CopG/Arc/MetJ family transcriptional regulator